MQHLAICITAGLLVGCSAQPLHFGPNGFPRGTGWRTYESARGTVSLRDYYKCGKLEKSLWYKPDGTVIREESWADGSGTGLYLYDDGSIKAAMPYVRGKAHGFAIYWNRDGTMREVVQYHRGEKVGESAPGKVLRDKVR